MIGVLSTDDIRAAVRVAEQRIRPYVRETPLEPSPTLSREGGCNVLLKLENLQVTGSFKPRGAFSKLLSLSPVERLAGITTASTGNHANAMAHALETLDVPGEIFMPSTASPAKIETLVLREAALRLVEDDPAHVEAIARREAEASGRVFVSPYNDLAVIGGQGTIAAELERQLGGLPDAVIVPVGGGGLIAGIAGYLKAAAPGVTIVGAQPAASPVIAQSLRAGGELLALPWAPSLSDATVGLVEPGAITYPVCRDFVDEWILLAEDEIAQAMLLVMARHAVMVEGAGVLSVAAFLQRPARWAGRTVVCIVSGSHIPLDELGRVLTGRPALRPG